ncbi:hypothetical protein D3C73_1401100 [compost metagenome]
MDKETFESGRDRSERNETTYCRADPVHAAPADRLCQRNGAYDGEEGREHGSGLQCSAGCPGRITRRRETGGSAEGQA